MQDVTEGSGDTAEAVQKQLEMTEDIQKRVNDVKNGADRIISNVSSAKEAVAAGNENLNTLMQQVNHSVESGKTVTAQLSDLKAITENSYEEFKYETNKYAHDYTLIVLQGRLAANPSISSKEVAKLVADDVKYLLEELALNNRYFGPKKV